MTIWRIAKNPWYTNFDYSALEFMKKNFNHLSILLATHWKMKCKNLKVFTILFPSPSHNWKWYFILFSFAQGLLVGYMCCLLEAMLATILHFCYVHAITCSRSKKEYGIQEKFKITYDNTKLFQVFQIANMVFSHVQNLTIFSTKMYVHWLSNLI